MRWSSFDCILATVLYSDIFDFPLTDTEIHRWLIVPRHKVSPRLTLAVLSKIPHTKDGYYSMEHLSKRTLIRKQRNTISEKKLQIAYSVIGVLRFIPTIDLIGISGGLSMKNVKEEDDIDLFFICQPGTIWSSRFFVVLFLSLLGRRRVYGKKFEKDLICPNMFIVNTSLRMPVRERNVYTAHEILQMEPIFVRGDIYFQFIQKNEWVGNLLPNAWKWRFQQAQYMKTRSRTLFPLIGTVAMKLVNPYLKVIQIIIMRSHKTIEIVTDTTFRFHPEDAKPYVLKCFLQSLNKYHIPLDSQIF